MELKTEAKEFYLRLNELIKKQNTTQEYICGLAGINIGTFRNRQTNGTFPNVYEGFKMAEGLDTTVEFLVTGKENGIPHEIMKIAYEITALPTMFQELLFGNLEMYKRQCLQQEKAKVSDVG